MNLPPVVSPAQGQVARDELLAEEKEATRARDALAAKRRRLPDGGTSFTTGRGVEALGSTWTFLDLTPLGRQEEWEDSPAGDPQTPPYGWRRRHDEYEDPHTQA